MEGPKGMRNGPCGGSIPEACYVDKTRPCIWYEIYKRSYKMGCQEKLMEVLPPLDWEKTGGETWGDVVDRVKEMGKGKVVKGLLFSTTEERLITWDGIFRPVRQPEWWQGDDSLFTRNLCGHHAAYSDSFWPPCVGSIILFF
jgi:hypothetical protein